MLDMSDYYVDTIHHLDFYSFDNFAKEYNTDVNYVTDLLEEREIFSYDAEFNTYYGEKYTSWFKAHRVIYGQQEFVGVEITEEGKQGILNVIADEQNVKDLLNDELERMED